MKPSNSKKLVILSVVVFVTSCVAGLLMAMAFEGFTGQLTRWHVCPHAVNIETRTSDAGPISPGSQEQGEHIALTCTMPDGSRKHVGNDAVLGTLLLYEFFYGLALAGVFTPLVYLWVRRNLRPT